MEENANERGTEIDWDAVDARIDGFTTRTSYSPATMRALRKLWRQWEEHCTDLECDPRAASWAVWQELSRRRRLDGRRYNNPYLLEAILWAVRWRYGAEGLQVSPAPSEPRRATDWEALTRDYRNQWSLAAAAGELEHLTRQPMMRVDIARILALPPESIPFSTMVGAPRDPAAYRAELLLALDSGWSGTELLSLRTSDFSRRRDGGLVVRDLSLACDHRERVPGVPWDCTACAISHTLAGRAVDEIESRGVVEVAVRERSAG